MFDPRFMRPGSPFQPPGNPGMPQMGAPGMPPHPMGMPPQMGAAGPMGGPPQGGPMQPPQGGPGMMPQLSREEIAKMLGQMLGGQGGNAY